MPRRKIIVDSDDEDEGGDSHSSAASDAGELDMDPGKAHAVNSSEEALYDQICEAHDNLLAASPIPHAETAQTITIPLKDADQSSYASGKKKRARSQNNEREDNARLRSEGNTVDLRASSDGEMNGSRRKRSKRAHDSMSTEDPSAKIFNTRGNLISPSEHCSSIPTISDSSPRHSPRVGRNRLTSELAKQLPHDLDNEQDELDSSILGSGPTEKTSMLVKSTAKDGAEPESAIDGSHTKTKRSWKGDLEDELGSEDSVIGLPIEQYQPRPSRSRSRRNGDLVEPMDFSKRPETVAKSVKTRKDPSPVTQNEILTSELALRNDADAARIPAGDKRVTENGAEGTETPEDQVDEATLKALESSKPAKKQRGRPKKDAAVDVIAVQEDVDERPNKVQRENGTEIAETKSPKKRGRPSKKSLSIAEPAEQIVPIDAERPTKVGAGQDAGCEPLQETAANVTPAKPLGKTDIQSEPVEQASTPPEPKPTALSKQSPTSQSGQTFRVGLSKRARIQPLLKIVRK